MRSLVRHIPDTSKLDAAYIEKRTLLTKVQVEAYVHLNLSVIWWLRNMII